MDLDKLKEAWESRRFEGELFDRAERQAMLLGTRKRFRYLTRAPGEGSRMETVAAGMSVFLIAVGLFRGDTRAEAMLWIAANAALLGVAYYIRRKRRRITIRRFDLPKKQFLEHEIGRLGEEIRLDKLAGWLFLLPMTTLAFYLVRRDWSAAAIAGFWVGLALAAAVLYWIELRRLRKLEEVRGEVERELSDLMANGH